jgi:hypothetical protein
MDAVQVLFKKPSNTDSLALTIFGFAVLYALLWGSKVSILVGLAFIMMMLGALPQQMALAFLVGATVIILLQSNKKCRRGIEGFADAAVATDNTGSANQGEPTTTDTEQINGEVSSDEENEESEEKDKEAFRSKPLLPDNTDRKEPLVLGKAYKMPTEADDTGFHLDAGTTFLNAYKAMKPDQIAAMTRDTQELLATQKSLVSMLDSFAPLMKDMGKITGFLGSK